MLESRCASHDHMDSHLLPAPGLLAQDAAPMALDQFGDLPAGHVVVRGHGADAEQRFPYRIEGRGHHAPCHAAARRAAPARARPEEAPLPDAVSRWLDRELTRPPPASRPNGPPMKSTCRCRAPAATPGCRSTWPAATSNTNAPTGLDLVPERPAQGPQYRPGLELVPGRVRRGLSGLFADRSGAAETARRQPRRDLAHGRPGDRDPRGAGPCSSSIDSTIRPGDIHARYCCRPSWPD